MPKLRFLDAKSVDKIELLSLMQLNEVTNNHQSAPQHSRAKMDKLFRFFGLATKEVRPAGRSALTPIPDPRNEYSPLPIDGPATTQPAPKTVYCKLKNHYEGSQSQGNRFILNQDLWKCLHKHVDDKSNKTRWQILISSLRLNVLSPWAGNNHMLFTATRKLCCM